MILMYTYELNRLIEVKKSLFECKKSLGDWSYPCQVDSIKKTKQPLRFDILSELDG